MLLTNGLEVRDHQLLPPGRRVRAQKALAPGRAPAKGATTVLLDVERGVGGPAG